MTEDKTISHDEWAAQARALFGADPMTWAFVCPHCGDVATGADFKEVLDQRLADGRGATDASVFDTVGQECIGRTLGALETDSWAGRGCTWAAYGLFAGPVFVRLPGGHTAPIFAFADPDA